MKDEIFFTIIVDPDEELQPITDLLHQFETQTGNRVRLSPISWEEAWSKLFSIAVNGEGSHVAQIGSTWSSSLMGMRSLRAFTSSELKGLGAPEAFFSPAWQSVDLGAAQTFAIPWTTYTLVLCYRRDLLQQAAIKEKNAFTNPTAMFETLSQLQQTGIEFPWLLPASFPNPDLVHLASSWVWDAGGDFVSANGKQTLFNTPESRSGLASFLDIFRFVPSDSQIKTIEDALELFAQGKGAVLIIDVDTANDMLQESDFMADAKKQIGFAPMPGIPWVGGDNLVIWDHVYNVQLQKACFSLVKFLTSQEAQIAYSNTTIRPPARRDAMSHITIPPELSKIVAQILEKGRAHYSIPFWSRVENNLGATLNLIIAEFRTDVNQDKDVLLQKHLRPLSRKLDNILKG